MHTLIRRADDILALLRGNASVQVSCARKITSQV